LNDPQQVVTRLTDSRAGERIVLEGEADQVPDQEPGDIVFVLVGGEHEHFKRAGSDLLHPLTITLAEALCGFSRVVLKHLDGRGIHINHPQGRVLKPDQILKVPGEGMPLKRSDAKGNLYLVVSVTFPEDGWLKDDAISTLQTLLPKDSEPPIKADTVDEVDYDEDATADDVSLFDRFE
jgi:DnaJ family protein A protein 2